LKGVEAAKNRLEYKRRDLQTEESKPDTTEEEIAAVEQRRERGVMQRVELALTLEVRSRLIHLIFRTTLRMQRPWQMN